MDLDANGTQFKISNSRGRSLVADFLHSRIPGYAGTPSPETCNYVEKYWLKIEELESRWRPILHSTFRMLGPTVEIRDGYSTEKRLGGVLFTEEEYREFTATATECEAATFAVIENIGQRSFNHSREHDREYFRFEYPVGLGWKEFALSAPVAEDVVGRPIRCWYVITNNGRFGKYADNDAERPYDPYFRSKS